MTPLQRDTPPPPGASRTALFRDRFWGDGTPRLTAYEYQGLAASACFREGGLTCTGCHSLHRSHRIDVPDPAAQRALGRPDACSACHLDRDTRWLAEQRARLWGEAAPDPGSLSRADGAPLDVLATLAELHAGDVVAVARRCGVIDTDPALARRLMLGPDGRLDLQAVRELLDLQSDHVISMGE